MVQGNLVGVAAYGATDLGNEPLLFATLNPSNTPADPRSYGRLKFNRSEKTWFWT